MIFVASSEQTEALRQMEEKHFDKMKLDQLRNDIRAGIASGDAGTLDADEIKRRGRQRKAGDESSKQRKKR